MKEAFIDLETTGLDPWKNSVVEISGSILVGNILKESFQIFVKPNPKEQLDQKVLRIIGQTPTQLNERGVDSALAYVQFTSILNKYVSKFNKFDKLFFYAYNSTFDNQFLRAFFQKNGDRYFGSYFWTPDICVMRLAMEKLKPVRDQLENFKLATVAKYLGFEVEGEALHEGKYDIELTMAMYNKLKKMD